MQDKYLYFHAPPKQTFVQTRDYKKVKTLSHYVDDCIELDDEIFVCCCARILYMYSLRDFRLLNKIKASYDITRLFKVDENTIMISGDNEVYCETSMYTCRDLSLPYSSNIDFVSLSPFAIISNNSFASKAIVKQMGRTSRSNKEFYLATEKGLKFGIVENSLDFKYNVDDKYSYRSYHSKAYEIKKD
jgi:hypothetical protein